MTRSLFDLAGYLARLGAVAMLATTVAAMLIPGPYLPRHLPPGLLLHAIGFGAPALLAAFASRSTRENAGSAATIVAVALATEIAQALVPGRSVSGVDLAANAIGIGIGAPLGWVIHLGLLRRLRAAPGGQS